MTRELLPEELISSLFQQAIVLILQSHGFSAAHPLALNLIIERVEKRISYTEAALMANTQRRTIPSPIDLSYAFLMENIHTYDLEDEMSRWPFPPQLHPQKEPIHPALLPSPVNELVYTRAILPSALRPQTNTPAFIPPSFPTFPPKYTYSFTPSYPPRAVDPETIRKKVVEDRTLIESSLAKLIMSGHTTKKQTTRQITEKEGREKRDEVWWKCWREMGCDIDGGNEGIWPVERGRRGGVTWSL